MADGCWVHRGEEEDSEDTRPVSFLLLLSESYREEAITDHHR